LVKELIAQLGRHVPAIDRGNTLGLYALTTQLALDAITPKQVAISVDVEDPADPNRLVEHKQYLLFEIINLLLVFSTGKDKRSNVAI
jgi:hypothetical protein